MSYPSFQGFASEPSTYQHSQGSYYYSPSYSYAPMIHHDEQVPHSAPASSINFKSARSPKLPIQKRVRSKHLSCEPCRKKKTKCDRKEFCASCRIRGESCFWEGAVPLAPIISQSYPQASAAAQREITRLRNLVHHLASQLGVSPDLETNTELLNTYLDGASPPGSSDSPPHSPQLIENENAREMVDEYAASTSSAGTPAATAASFAYETEDYSLYNAAHVYSAPIEPNPYVSNYWWGGQPGAMAI